MSDTNTALLCPDCKAILFVCNNDRSVLENSASDLAEGLSEGYLPVTLSNDEVRGYKAGFGCKCPKYEQLEMFEGV